MLQLPPENFITVALPPALPSLKATNGVPMASSAKLVYWAAPAEKPAEPTAAQPLPL